MKLGWGHSPADYVTDIALAANVRKLALFHHDPTHDDDAIAKIEETQRARAAAAGSKLDIFAAAEGMEFQLAGHGLDRTILQVSALDRRPIAGGHVLVVTHHQADISSLEQVLPDDGLLLTSAVDGKSAMESTARIKPDLVIINSNLRDGEGASFIHPLRTVLGRADLPVILLTEDRDGTESLYSAESTATDYLARPFSPPMLRTRVRAWLARTIGATGTQIEVQFGQPNDAVAPLTVAEEESVSSPHDLLSGMSLFSGLTPEQRAWLIQRSMDQTFGPGQTIIRQEDPSELAYVILSGRVRVLESVPDSPVEMFLSELSAGEIFGELGVLRETRRAATVLTLNRTRVLAIAAKDFLHLLSSSREMSMALLRVLAARLHDADRLLARHAPDPLTGLPGRRAFHELYRRLSAGSKRRGGTILLLMLDVLHLKDINDQFGYSVGDDVLRTLGDALLESSRSTDLIARYGADEFVALLVDAGAKDVDVIVNRVQQKLRQLVVYRNLPLTVECRIGFAVTDNPGEGPEELLRLADEDMQGKRSIQTK
jgi:diguanylate cyclase (GGDEF)-like protein